MYVGSSRAPNQNTLLLSKEAEGPKDQIYWKPFKTLEIGRIKSRFGFFGNARIFRKKNSSKNIFGVFLSPMFKVLDFFN